MTRLLNAQEQLTLPWSCGNWIAVPASIRRSADLWMVGSTDHLIIAASRDGLRHTVLAGDSTNEHRPRTTRDVNGPDRSYGWQDGRGTQVVFGGGIGSMAIDAATARLWIPDSINHCVRMLYLAGPNCNGYAVTTVAGSTNPNDPESAGTRDNADPTIARFSNPVRSRHCAAAVVVSLHTHATSYLM